MNLKKGKKHVKKKMLNLFCVVWMDIDFRLRRRIALLFVNNEKRMNIKNGWKSSLDTNNVWFQRTKYEIARKKILTRGKYQSRIRGWQSWWETWTNCWIQAKTKQEQRQEGKLVLRRHRKLSIYCGKIYLR